jgi:hypothetical protein
MAGIDAGPEWVLTVPKIVPPSTRWAETMREDDVCYHMDKLALVPRLGYVVLSEARIDVDGDFGQGGDAGGGRKQGGGQDHQLALGSVGRGPASLNASRLSRRTPASEEMEP